MINENNIVELDAAIRSAYQRKAHTGSFEEQIEGFARAAAQQNPLYEIEIETVRKPLNYKVTFEGRKCRLHSRYDIEREMEKMFEGVSQETEVLVLFGLGAGYALEYAGEHLPHLERVFVVEPSNQIMNRALREKEVVERLKKAKTITFLWNRSREEVAANLSVEINNYLNQKISLVFHLAYRSLFREYFDGIADLILQHVRGTQVNMATVHGNIFLKNQNIIKNLNAESIDIELLLQRLRGRPAIMVSAGPSLDNNVHLLQAAKEKCFIVAVGSAVKILHNKGIKPHARAAFSPYPDENTVFDGIGDFEGIPLIYSNTLDYLVVEKYDAPKARMVMIGDSMSQYFYQLSGYKHSLVGGGSTIANVTFDLLCRAGCSQVIFLGQDMAYTGLKLYAADSWSNPTFEASTQGLIKTRDMYGNEIYTGRAFIGLKSAFESTIAAFPNVEVINSSEGGLGFSNAPNRPLQEVLDGMPGQDFQALIDEAFAEGQAARLETDAVAFKNALELALKELVEILRLNQERIGIVQSAVREKEGINQTLKRLEAVQAIEQRLMEIGFYRFVILPELSTPFFAIRAGMVYRGTDKRQRADMIQKTELGIALKLEEFGFFIKEQLEEQLALL